MNILIIYAHPEKHSLQGALKTLAVQHLNSLGHQVLVSDLYEMSWKSQLDAGDMLSPPVGDYFHPVRDSKYAFENGLQSDDIIREQEKVVWADAVIFQFPLWWLSMPAIMKGWVDRVYANGFAYGVGEFSETRCGNRYDEGTFAGKRAMLLVTTGGGASYYGPRGIGGHIDDILFPLHHGILFYPGFEVLPPMVIYQAHKMDDLKFAALSSRLKERLDNLWHTDPLPYRKQNSGDYLLPELTLRPDILSGETGLHIHLNQ